MEHEIQPVGRLGITAKADPRSRLIVVCPGIEPEPGDHRHSGREFFALAEDEHHLARVIEPRFDLLEAALLHSPHSADRLARFGQRARERAAEERFLTSGCSRACIHGRLVRNGIGGGEADAGDRQAYGCGDLMTENLQAHRMASWSWSRSRRTGAT